MLGIDATTWFVIAGLMLMLGITLGGILRIEREYLEAHEAKYGEHGQYGGQR